MITVLKKALITEKTMFMAKNGMFTFLVDKNATKELIAKVVKGKFNVDVKSVNLSSFKPETKRQRTGRGYFTIKGGKKAVIKLKKGQTIGLFQPEDVKEEVQVRTADGEAAGMVKEKKNRLKGTKVKIEKTTEKAAAKADKKVTGK